MTENFFAIGTLPLLPPFIKTNPFASLHLSLMSKKRWFRKKFSPSFQEEDGADSTIR